MHGMKELADSIDLSRIRSARAASPVEKLLAGPRLFDRVRDVMASGIRKQFPQADEAEVRRMLGTRIALSRRLENERDE
jgi:hypothetical protein